MSKRINRIAGLLALASLALIAPVTQVKAETITDNNSYTVTIPSDVTLNSETGEGEMQITASLDAYSTLDISVSSDYELSMEDSNWKLQYSLTGDSTFDTENKKITYKNESSSGDEQAYSTTLKAEVTDTPQVCGTYKDTLTFTIDCTSSRESNYHKLTFDSNGGTCNITNRIVEEGKTYGELPTPTRIGYKFAGWYTEVISGEQVSTSSTIGTEDVTIHAHWTPNKLYIYYHNDGATSIHWESGDVDVAGKDVGSSQTETYGEKFSNGVSGLYDVWRWKRTGYTNTGSSWKIGKDGTKEYNDHEPFTNAEDCAKYLDVLEEFEKGDVTVDLYPIWTANTYTITYNKNSDDATGNTKPSKHTYDVVQSLTANGFSREGYTFTGWNESADGTGQAYADREPVENLTSAKGVSVTLYAQWEKKDSSTDVQSDTNAIDDEDKIIETEPVSETEKNDSNDSEDMSTADSESEDSLADTDANNENSTSETESSAQSTEGSDNSSENADTVDMETEEPAEDAAMPGTEPETQAVSEPATESTSEVSDETTVEPETQAVSEPVTESTPEVSDETTVEPETQAVSEPATESIPEFTTEEAIAE